MVAAASRWWAGVLANLDRQPVVGTAGGAVALARRASR